MMVAVFFVEIDGFEPTTLCLQSRCSSQLSYTPFFRFFCLIAASYFASFLLTTARLLRRSSLVFLALRAK